MKLRLEKQNNEPEIPTSSMADIAFLLIVFFMLTTVFSANRGMEHVLPPNQQRETVEPEESIYVHVLSENRFTVDQQEYPISQAWRLYDYVNEKLQVNARKPVIVHTEANAPYSAMIKVMDQLEMLDEDLEGISIDITIPSKAEKKHYAAAMGK